MLKKYKKSYFVNSVYKNINKKYNRCMIEKNTIMSPMQIWHDFNPVSTDTEVSIINLATENDVVTTEIMFTASEVNDGKIRAYMKYSKKIDAPSDAPVILVIHGINYNIEKEVIDNIINKNMIYATFDFAGVNDKHTEYPNSVYYGNFESIKNIIDVSNGPKQTCWYLWDVIARRVITVLNEQLDNPKICLVGVGLGANIGWQVAGMDGRISAFIAINGDGYIENLDEYLKPVKKDDYPTAWLAGLAPQSYAKYISCPILYVGGSNNANSNVDKISEILGLSPSENKYMSICHNAENKITLEAFNTIEIWTKEFFLGDANKIEKTEVSFSNSGDRLYLNVKTNQEDVEKITILVSTKEKNNDIREWKQISKYTALNNGEYVVPLELESTEDIVYCYVNTYYTSGLVLSSKLISIVPSELEITDANIVQKVPTRIVYNTSMEDDYFYGENESFVFDRNKIIKKEGAFGVKGIGLDGGGSLYTFRVGNQKFRDNIGATLKMDAYTTIDTTIDIVVYNLEDGELVPYQVAVFLGECDKWQQIELTDIEFKNYEMISLDGFSDIKKIELKNIGSVIFNNIIWV